MKKWKKIVFSVVALLIVAGGLAGCYFVGGSLNYLKTDNAKVTAEMVTLRPNSSGSLLEWNVLEGDAVKKDQVMGRTEQLPYITSPIGGTVVQSEMKRGQLVSPETALAVVADTSNLYIGVNIEETEINKVKIGQGVEVEIDAYPGKKFNGVVTEINNTTQTYFSSTGSFTTSGTYTKVTQLIPLKVVIEDTEALPMRLGMNATVKINLRDRGNLE